MSNDQVNESTGEVTDLLPPSNGRMITVQDNSQFANLLDTGRYEQMRRVAMMLAGSSLAPDHFKRKPYDCFLAANMAIRMGVDPLLLMQNIYIVHGKPGMQAQLAIALINSSGLFKDPLEYEVEGDVPTAQDYRVRCYAVRSSTGKMVLGPWIDWKIVRAERWDQKDGSKWKTMPGLMFMYRAASWFGRTSCPERLMGMQTVDELEDVGPIRTVESTQLPPAEKAQAMADRYRSENGGQRQSAETTPASIQANGATGSPLPVAAEPGPVAPASKPAIPAQQALAPTGAGPATGDEKGEINDAEALSQDWPLAVSFMCAQYDGQIADEEVKKGIDRYVVNCGKKGKESKIVTATRIALLSAIRDGSFDFVTGRIEKR